MDLSDLTVRALKRLPKNTLSRAFGVVSEIEFPESFQGVVNQSFAALTGVDIEEAEKSPDQYDTLNAYFTRRLRQGARPIEADDDSVVVSPVDGALGAFGAIDEGTLFQAKGRQYQLLDLVDSAREAEHFDGGWYATIYLSPRDYHRIHSPVSGAVDRISYIPGHLFPVNPFAVSNIDDLFAVNERLITYLDTAPLGRVAVIKVGATCVGRIGLSYDAIKTNGRLRRRREFEPRSSTTFEHGDELAVFNLGSTVILLLEQPRFAFDRALKVGDVLRMGESLGAVAEGNS